MGNWWWKYTTRSHGWSTTKLKDLITQQTIKQNPGFAKEWFKDSLEEKNND